MESSSRLALAVAAFLVFTSFALWADEYTDSSVRFEGRGGMLLDSLSLYPWDGTGGEAQCRRSSFRIVVRTDDSGTRPFYRLRLESLDGFSGQRKDTLGPVVLRPSPRGLPGDDRLLVSDWIALVGTYDERLDPKLKGHALMAHPMDRVIARVSRGGERSEQLGIVVGSDEGPRQILHVDVRVTLMATEAGVPVVGGTAKGAREIVYQQLADVNRILSACHMTLGDPREVEVSVLPSPPASMIVIGGRLGLLSAGGRVSFKVDGEPFGPLRLGAGFTPEETARYLAGELRAEGYRAQLRVLSESSGGAFPAADVIVRSKDGEFVEMSTLSDTPLSTDPMQEISLGIVSLENGLEGYGVNETGTGTVEERALLSAAFSGKTGMREVVVVGEISGGAKQGESFLAQGAGAGIDAAIVDARALDSVHSSHTLAHELVHLLLGDLEHPDSRGDPRPMLLMNARASSARMGPSMLTDEECEKMRSAVSETGL